MDDSSNSDSDSDSDVNGIGTLPGPRSGSSDDCNLKHLHKIQPSQGCTFLNDDNSMLQYSDGWIFNSSNPNVPTSYTIHLASHPGPSVSLTFNG